MELKKRQVSSVLKTAPLIFPLENVNTENKQQLAGIAKKSQEGQPRNSWSRDTAMLRTTEDCISHVQRTKDKDLSHEFSRTDSQILGSLSKLDEFFLNPHVRVQPGTIFITSRISNVENKQLNEDCSENDPSTEVGISIYRSTQYMNRNPNEAYYTLAFLWHHSQMQKEIESFKTFMNSTWKR